MIQCIILIAFILLGCNNTFKHTKTLKIDEELSIWFYSFILAGHANNMPTLAVDDLIMSLSPITKSSTLGMCHTGPYMTPTIEINQYKWPDLSQYGKEQLVFHELGHCVLNRPHNDEMMNYEGWYVPVSIMYYGQFSDDIYINHRQYYIQELFNGGKK